MQQQQHTSVAATAVLLALMALSVQGQQDFTIAAVPNPFRVGDFYPPRPEVEVCRPIRDYIDRNSARFTNELVTNSNNDISFSTADSRIMSSRMQSRLNTLAAMYRADTGRRITVLRAWTQFPSSQINNDMSLHYEGRSVQVRLSSGSDYNQFLQMAVQAAFDWVAFNRSNLVTLSVIPTNCDRSVDCVFVLDRSGSVGRTNHDIAIRFIQNIVAFFSIGLNQTRVGFVAYSSTSQLEFDLDDYTTLNSLTNRIGDVRYTRGGTGTGRALNLARNVMNPASNHGARPDEEGIPKIVVLITDGHSGDAIITPSNNLKNAGVIVYTVGIGRVDVNELRDISSDPDSEHVFLLRSYDDARGFVDFLSVTTCETPAIINPDGNVTTTIPPGGLEYFQTECPAYNDRVLVELTDLNGTNFLYASTTVDNPGPLTDNTLRNETTGISRRTLTLSIPSGSNVVYIGVQGQAQENAFNIIVWDQLFSPSDVSTDFIEGSTGQQLIYDISQNLDGRAPTSSLRYSIIEGNEAGLFTIGSDGRVFVRNAAQLNPRTREFHNLTVLAQHVSINCQRSRIRIGVRILSNRIMFGQVITATVREDASVNTQVARVTASGGRGEITFSITNGNVGNSFSIGSLTGRIRVNSPLNYETDQSYFLTIRAQTTESGTVTETTTQRINIQDVNEAPFFVTACARGGSCAFSIDERQPVNTLVGTVEVDDPDLPSVPNGQLLYTLAPLSLPFAVNSSGRITARESLDREVRDTYTMTLSVTDGSVRIETTVTVRVNDVDDNAPVFSLAPGTIQVQENTATGTEVAQYIATDSDIGTNAAIIYELTSNSQSLPFTLNRQTGILSVSGSIDFESTESYTVTVTARNPNNVTSSVSRMTQISIVNLNDNRPQFNPTQYAESLPENSPVDRTVVTVSATDADRGSFGMITYSITSGNFQDSFSIDGASGSITTNRVINREVVSSFSLAVEARDQGGRRRTVAVEITITDVNDNPPMFVNSPYQVQVREDVAVPFDILQVAATDADEQGNPNSQIAYSITGGNVGNAFSIDSSTGQIRVVQSLDFENVSSYTLNLQARDGGTPARTDSTTATITVINVNENPPSISGNQSVEISESASVGSIVASYTALDPDNNVVTFSISSGNLENRFTIDSSNGRITLANALDYEQTTSYMLSIEASDGQRSSTATLTVTVLDENEFAPMFMGGTRFSVNEEELDGTLVGTVRATDADRDPANNQVSYSFVQQTTHFMINPRSGQIRTMGVLDRENLTQVFVPPASQLRLDVTARDSASPSRQTTRSITITLVDINDNSPQFADGRYESSILENLPSGQTVFQVSASDLDLGTNGEVRYSFTLNRNAGDSSLFTIDATTGILTTTSSLDCERQASYNFTITATDRGTSPRSSTVQGTLNVIDENDNSPVFSMNPYTVSVPENSQTDSTLITVTATDEDKELNGQVTYSVVNEGGIFASIEGQGDEFTIFAINSSTGVLSHRSSFDYERASQVNVTVIAEDRGVPRRSSNTTVVINVMNIDERPPLFTTCPRNVFVNEDLEPNSIITNCIAEDPDNVTTSNSQQALSYSITAGNEGGLFAIDVSTGAISTVNSLDRERQQSYELTITATDLSSRTASRTVGIGIRDTNDNTPRFTQTSYTYDFTDSRIQNHVQDIVRISAIDEDNAENGTIRYSLPDVDKSSLVTTILTITASDMGNPPRSRNVTLTVNFENSCLLQEYEINPLSGVVSAYVLCSIQVQPESLNVSLGSSDSMFRCSILHNSRLSYQWVHNGSLITLPTLLPEGNSNPVTYTVANARFEHAGEYACKATTQAGSLQTSGSSVKIRAAPAITIPPMDATVAEGSTATFTCAGTGIPLPTIRWYNDFGEFLLEGGTLVRVDVQVSRRNAKFICDVSNDFGTAQATASLIVYTRKEVVGIEVSSVSNPTPTESGVCHYINKTMIENTLETTTKRGATVTGFQGNDICEESACVPNPCQNRGVCSISDTDVNGYVCSCPSGYVGTNCDIDRDECIDDPCFDGTCVNTEGGFLCQCTNLTTGHLCQYDTTCQNPNVCTEGTTCVSMLGQGYDCEEPPSDEESLAITGSMTEKDLGFLADLVQTEVERSLAALAAATSRRRKRQTNAAATTLATFCEPRFIQPRRQEDTFLLIWICPENVSKPLSQDQVILCDILLGSPLVSTCKPPFGQVMVPPTLPPLEETSVTINIVLTDTSGKPIDALVSEKEIEESGGRERLEQVTGLSVASLGALDNSERGDQNSGKVNPGVVVGAIMGVLVGVVLVIAVAIGVVIYIRKKRDEDEQKQLRRRMAVEMVEQETGGASNGTQVSEAVDTTSTTAFDKTTSDKPTDENAYDSLSPKERLMLAEKHAAALNGGGAHSGNGTNTKSTDNLLASQDAAEESTYDSLTPATRVEESHYDTPRKY